MVVLAINWTITWWVSRGLPRQVWVMKANSRCSIRFHLTRLFGLRPYGVGAGNVPVIIDRDVDLKDAAEKIVAGASFDNGIICSHEQFVLTPDELYEDTVQAFLATGKVWYTATRRRCRRCVRLSSRTIT